MDETLTLVLKVMLLIGMLVTAADIICGMQKEKIPEWIMDARGSITFNSGMAAFYIITTLGLVAMIFTSLDVNIGVDVMLTVAATFFSVIFLALYFDASIEVSSKIRLYI